MALAILKEKVQDPEQINGDISLYSSWYTGDSIFEQGG